ncbi:hypothetical protein [Bradyrhizobium sp. 142]|nr:hypothetical protein [Bradyrhizobium sp. 142]
MTIGLPTVHRDIERKKREKPFSFGFLIEEETKIVVIERLW